jgi:hypothetical protein
MKDSAQIQLTVSIIKQGNRFIAYSPAFDLSTSGRSEKQVKRRFEEAASLFVEELAKAGTMNDVLKELGWYQVRKQWEPPKIISQESIGFRMPVVA